MRSVLFFDGGVVSPVFADGLAPDGVEPNSNDGGYTD